MPRVAIRVADNRGPYPYKLFDAASVRVYDVESDGSNAADGESESRFPFAALNVHAYLDRREQTSGM